MWSLSRWPAAAARRARAWWHGRPAAARAARWLLPAARRTHGYRRAPLPRWRLVPAVLLPLALLVTWDAPRLGGGLGMGGQAARVEAAPERQLTGPKPPVISRADWGADEDLRSEPATYTGAARAVFIHHTGHPDDYDCADVPDMLRAMYADHVQRLGWDDLGYNFVVDKCGRIYEGRAGGVDRSVLGAHTTGFNHDSVGIAALGDFSDGELPQELLASIARVAAWKLRPGADPHGQVRLVSTNDASRYPEGTATAVDVISGHRDIFYTHCPGDGLYEALPEIRDATARLRPRPR